MAAATREGYRWPTICGGKATCTTCFVQVVEGRASVPPAGLVETNALRMLVKRFADDPGRIRLACQVTVAGDGVVVLRPGVRRAEGEIHE
ncbi:MAG: (2Fe-2S)-binding protein [Sporichthya sp.]|nr:(2Fe-2S)-binding protein [Sporichthya sp.]